MKIALAYSGGLDTSVCIHWLKEKYKAEIICVYGQLGQKENLMQIKSRALACGASRIYCLDLRKEFIEDYVFPALRAEAIYGKGYLLFTALTRPLIAKKLVEIARKEKCRIVSHGCSGKGNDQVRFELTAFALNPYLKIIAPLREWELSSRQEEIDYVHKYRLPVNVSKKSPYSVDENLWGRSIECGVLEDPEIAPPGEIYKLTKDPQETPGKPIHLEIYFEKGIPCKINRRSYGHIALISFLNKIGGRYGIGRVDMIEDRLIGIKSREIYESPAASILYAAHQELETLVLDRETLQYKKGISDKYGQLVYYGLWFSPLKKALDAFVNETQKEVTGTVRLKLYKGKCIVSGRSSPYSLYEKDLATYEKGSSFDQKLARGFIEIWGLPLKINALKTARIMKKGKRL